MLNPRLIVEQPEQIKAELSRRNAGPEVLQLIDTIGELAHKRTELIGQRDALRNQRNTLSRQIGGLMRDKKTDEANAIKARVVAGNEQTKGLEDALAQIEAKQHQLSMTLPNILHADVPPGKSEEDNQILRSWGVPASIEGPLAHVEVGEALGQLDLERSAKLTGARFAVLKGPLARLERALAQFFLNTHTDEHNYTEVVVPYIVHRRMMEGTGQLPKFEDDCFRLSEPVNGADAFLIPTAEVPVTNLHREEIIDEADLPIKYVAFTPCFRAEAGSAGRDVRGLIRQHQFHKVELVQITTPQQSAEAHEQLTLHAERCLQQLKLPYRVLLLCAGDTGFSATKCYDLEVWMPSQGRYREVSSCSTFSDFQARRMSLRYRPNPIDGKKQKPKLAHTVNGSALAVGRTMVAILENFQLPDGRVAIPEVLQPYMAGKTHLEPLG